jgi:hypothetical protein
MKIDENLLFGIYELTQIHAVQDGQQTTERANAGMFVFTRDRKLSVVSGSNEWVMAYTGLYELKDDMLSIHVKSCVVRELEGTTILRRVLKLDGTNLVLDASGSNPSKQTKISWRKTTEL